MDDATLSPTEVDRLRALPLTYAEVGATSAGLPDGYHHVSREAVLGAGEAAFRQAADALSRWELQRRAGVRVLPAAARVAEGVDAVLLLGVGRLAVRAPVRVVRVVDEPRRTGFAYGTLPGHPESGEESFLVEWRPDGSVVCRITAFSRPVTWLARLGGPATTLVQGWVTGRYLRSLRA